jgi:hypothetical protein
MAMPTRKTRRGPNSSASRPAVGCATALVRYRLEIRIEVWPTDTPMAAAIDTRAVAMTELLMGLRAEPMNIGVTNRGPNGRVGSAVPVSAAASVSVSAAVSG